MTNSKLFLIWFLILVLGISFGIPEFLIWVGLIGPSVLLDIFKRKD